MPRRRTSNAPKKPNDDAVLTSSPLRASVRARFEAVTLKMIQGGVPQPVAVRQASYAIQREVADLLILIQEEHEVDSGR